MRGLRVRDGWRCYFIIRTHSTQSRKLLCTSTSNSSKTNKAGGEGGEAASIRDLEGYRQLEKLDFMMAVKMLFTTPAKRRQFGLDFHLVQLFFACMPALAVYLVAQYARYEMRRMEAELEVKKKKEDELKAKEAEAIALEEAEKAKSDPELLKVKVRLEALEEAVKEIAVETRKQATKKDEVVLRQRNLKHQHSQKANLKKGVLERRKLERLESENRSEENSSAVDGNHSVNQPGSAIDDTGSQEARWEGRPV